MLAKNAGFLYNSTMDIIKEKLIGLPQTPGCYIMKDRTGTVIYVGKAVNLKRRVSQYFHANVKGEKVRRMVENIADFEYVVTQTEIDALSLESNLIKKHKPHYNILLKDDKQYPYIRVDVKSDFPTFTIARRIKKDGAKYFGPFMGGVSIKDVLEILNLAFQIRPCTIKIDQAKPKRPCLHYHMHKCLSPCSGACEKGEYRERVLEAIDFLSGNDEPVESILTQKMQHFAALEQFEVAIRFKNQLSMLDKIKQKRLTSLSRFLNLDVIAYETDGIYRVINVLLVRSGRMQGALRYELSDLSDDKEESLENFILQFYKEERELPDEVLLNGSESTYPVLENYLKTLYGKAVSVWTPKVGVKKQLLDMSVANAREYLEKTIERIQAKDEMTVRAAERLQNLLSLSRYPKRMECYDISNISGVDKVGSMVVFVNGEPAKEEYRRFKIKTVQGANDFESLKEVLTRRLQKLGTEEESHFPRPDLIIIDGGKGQLSSVKNVFDNYGIQGIDLISLAKREEEVFLPNQELPIVISHRDSALKLLQRIRDEAHRFAITYHRNLRDKHEMSLVLETFSGIGKAKAKALLLHFKSFDKIKQATLEELMEVPGIGKMLAKTILDACHTKEKQ